MFVPRQETLDVDLNDLPAQRRRQWERLLREVGLTRDSGPGATVLLRVRLSGDSPSHPKPRSLQEICRAVAHQALERHQGNKAHTARSLRIGVQALEEHLAGPGPAPAPAEWATYTLAQVRIEAVRLALLRSGGAPEPAARELDIPVKMLQSLRNRAPPLAPVGAAAKAPVLPLAGRSLYEVLREFVAKALEANGGNRSATSRQLGICRMSVQKIAREKAPRSRARPPSAKTLAEDHRLPIAGLSLAAARQAVIERALSRHGGNVTAAARELQITRATVGRAGRGELESKSVTVRRAFPARRERPRRAVGRRTPGLAQ